MGPWSDSGFHHTSNHCVPSFNFVTLIVVEKTVTKIYLMTKDGMREGRKEERMTEGQGKFQSRSIIIYKAN